MHVCTDRNFESKSFIIALNRDVAWKTWSYGAVQLSPWTTCSIRLEPYTSLGKGSSFLLLCQFFRFWKNPWIQDGGQKWPPFLQSLRRVTSSPQIKYIFRRLPSKSRCHSFNILGVTEGGRFLPCRRRPNKPSLNRVKSFFFFRQIRFKLSSWPMASILSRSLIIQKMESSGPRQPEG